MDLDDRDGDGRTFKANFTGDGVAALRERVRETLSEFMGDYTDDTLVEYVIVLLRNGRRKDEAIQELNVFLGDDSAVFISWLWDHLALNLHLYVQPPEREHEEINNNEMPKEHSGSYKSPEVQVRSKVQADTEQASESRKAFRNRPKREWKGLVREGNETFPLRSVVTDILHGEERKLQKSNDVRQPYSSNLRNGRKRSREDEPQPTKRDSSSHPAVGATRRLLQFAVRDAVRTVQQNSSTTEPSSKRLRSVVSPTSADSMQDKRSHRSSCFLQAPGAALALKAAAVAAADSAKVRSSGSVFNRLGQWKDAAEHANQPSGVREEQRDDEEFEEVTPQNNCDYHRFSDEEDAGDLIILDKDTEMAVDSASGDDVDGDDGAVQHQTTESFNGALPCSIEKALVPCSATPETNAASTPRLVDEDPPSCSSEMMPSKIVSISVNVNTLEPSSYEMPGDVHVVENQICAPETDVSTAKPDGSILSQSSLVDNVKESGHADVRKDSHRTSTTVPSSYSTIHPTDDADSRTLYVSNVHFAATKDALSRHFNKFGAVLKVVIVTNAATGQPTGSAYVEFLHKESAERALSLNGTSFMTRILKVVRRSSHEAAHFFGWAGSGRSSLFARHSRMAYPRAVLPGAFRGRPPIKGGARSLQWKREPSTIEHSAGTKPDSTVSLSSAEQVQSPTM